MNKKFKKEYNEYLDNLTSPVENGELWSQLEFRLDKSGQTKRSLFYKRFLGGLLLVLIVIVSFNICTPESKIAATYNSDNSTKLNTKESTVSIPKNNALLETTNKKLEDLQKLSESNSTKENKEQFTSVAAQGIIINSELEKTISKHSSSIRTANNDTHPGFEKSIATNLSTNNVIANSINNSITANPSTSNISAAEPNSPQLKNKIFLEDIAKQKWISPLIPFKHFPLNYDRENARPRFIAEEIKPDIVSKTKAWLLEFNVSTGFINTSITESDTLNIYGNLLDSVLNYTHAFDFSAIPCYRYGQWNFGFGIHTQKIEEDFRIENMLSKNELFFNEQAFLVNGEYVGEEQYKIVLTDQNVYNRNSFYSLDVSPRVSYILGSSMFQLELGALARLNLYSNYSGSLVDTNGYLIKSGDVFSAKKQAFFSYGAFTSLRVKLISDLEIIAGGSLLMRNVQSDETFLPVNLRIQSVHLGLAKRF